MRWLLVEERARISEVGNQAHFTVWNNLNLKNWTLDAAELSALLKVMVMLEDAPASFIERLIPEHAELCRQGRQFRAQFPSYLGQQRARIVAHCPLPTVLQSLVVAYAKTTP